MTPKDIADGKVLGLDLTEYDVDITDAEGVEKKFPAKGFVIGPFALNRKISQEVMKQVDDGHWIITHLNSGYQISPEMPCTMEVAKNRVEELLQNGDLLYLSKENEDVVKAFKEDFIRHIAYQWNEPDYEAFEEPKEVK
jgi:hypothetical protein